MSQIVLMTAESRGRKYRLVMETKRFRYYKQNTYTLQFLIMEPNTWVDADTDNCWVEDLEVDNIPTLHLVEMLKLISQQ